MATDKIQTGIRFTEDMLLKISHIAKKNRRSLNAQLEFLAQTCIEKYEEENGEIALTEEDKSRYR
ncbi:Arc family DNA-binding protein [Bengtsoniella intestinalis]|uniref:Arc family DNA-binding protein n=1 Tax=Bengtsoniella intestinalis TaxID=3073143 RepID=UPI00391F9952